MSIIRTALVPAIIFLACAAAGAQTGAPSGVPVSAPAFPATTPFWGVSGLGVMPTSATVSPGQIQVAAGWEHIMPKLGGDVDLAPTFDGTIGLNRGEVGVGGVFETGSHGVPGEWGGDLYGKYRFFEDDTRGTSIAAGFDYFKPDGYGSDTSLFVTGGGPLLWAEKGREALRGETGALFQYSNLPAATRSTVRPMVGLDYVGAPSWTFAADYIPDVGTQPQLWTVLARYQPAGNLGGQVGYGQQFTRDEKIFVTLDYAIGR